MKKILFISSMLFLLAFTSCGGGGEIKFMEGAYEEMAGLGSTNIKLQICEYERGKYGMQMSVGTRSMGAVRMNVSFTEKDTIVSFEIPDGKDFPASLKPLLQEQKISVIDDGTWRMLFFHSAKNAFQATSYFTDEDEYRAVKAMMSAFF